MTDMRRLVLLGMASVLLSGCGASSSEDLQALRGYVEQQMEALESVVADGPTAAAVASAVGIAENARRHTNPGSPDGEWVGDLVWLGPPGPCQEHLKADGADRADAVSACRVSSRLWSVAMDLAFWADESNADDYEFWEEDQPDFFTRDLPEAIASAREFVG